MREASSRLHGSRCQTRLSPLVTAAPCSRPIAPFRFVSSRRSVAGAAPMSRTQATQGQACRLEWRPELLDVVEGSEGTAVKRGKPRARSLKWVKTRRGWRPYGDGESTGNRFQGDPELDFGHVILRCHKVETSRSHGSGRNAYGSCAGEWRICQVFIHSSDHPDGFATPI